MRSYPLVRKHLTNEHIMEALFFILLLYQLPDWFENPGNISSFLLVLFLGLLIDASINFIRYKKPVCAVSAAVTAAILQVLTPGVPLWGRLLAVAAALVIGKHLWGGTGKNVFNPAITAFLLLAVTFKLNLPVFPVTLLLMPAVILSIPFIFFRPFAGLGMIAGMAISLTSGHDLTLWTIGVNCIFFGCLVITDPVTSSPRPLAGLLGGFLAGFLPYFMVNTAYVFAFTILAFNLVSYIMSEYFHVFKRKWFPARLKIAAVIPFQEIGASFCDTTGVKEEITKEAITVNDDSLSTEDILESMETNEVFGCGGAAFPAIKKIRAVKASEAKEKYFIINAVECDPGLIHDKWLVKSFPDEIYKGITAVGRCIPFAGIFLAVKRNDGLNLPGNVKVIKVKDYYPAGAEKILIEELLKIKIPDGVIPANAGILVMNVQTVYAIYEAVYLKKKADTKYLTVTDLINKKSIVVKAKIGDKIHDVINGVYPQRGLVFSGGGMMQARMAEEDDIVEKSVNFIAAARMPVYKESPQCSRCGLCTSVCPSGLEAGRISDLVDEGRFKDTEKYRPGRCMSCGSCSYICLAGRNLSARVGEAKEFLKIHQKDTKMI